MVERAGPNQIYGYEGESHGDMWPLDLFSDHIAKRTLIGPNSWSDIQDRLVKLKNITGTPGVPQGFTTHNNFWDTALLLPKEGYLELETEYPWLMEFHAVRDGADSTASAKRLIDIVDPFMKSDRWEDLDSIMSRLDSPRYSSLFLLSLLRFTRPGKYYIPSWNNFRERVYQVLDSRDLEATKIMRGL